MHAYAHVCICKGYNRLVSVIWPKQLHYWYNKGPFYQIYRGKDKWLDMFIYVAVSFFCVFNYLCTELNFFMWWWRRIEEYYIEPRKKGIYYKQWNEGLGTSCVGSNFWNMLLKERWKEGGKWQEDEGEDVSSYWMTLRKWECTGI